MGSALNSLGVAHRSEPLYVSDMKENGGKEEEGRRK